MHVSPFSPFKCQMIALGFLLGFVQLGIPSQVHAATLTWSSEPFAGMATDGAGYWNTVDYHWMLDHGPVTWTHESPAHTAVFGNQNGAAGTVTLTENVWLSEIIFQEAGSGNYTIASTGIEQLIFDAGANLVAHTQASIHAPLQVNGDLRKSGLGNLILAGVASNVISGNSYLEQGDLTLAKTGGATALSGVITVETDARLLYTNQDWQLAEGTALILDGGRINWNNRSERMASYTQLAGGMLGSNTGDIVVDGIFKMSGGSVYTINSNGSLTAHTVDLRGMSSTTTSVNVGGAGTRVASAINVGAGGLWMNGQKIQLNYATADGQFGSHLNLGSDLVASGDNVIDSPGASHLYSSAHSRINLGSELRTFDLTSGSLRLQNLISVKGSGGLVKKGEGSLILALAGAANAMDVGTLYLQAGKITHAQHHVLNDHLEVQISGGKYEFGGRTETLKSLSMSGGQFESGNQAQLTFTNGLLTTGGTFTVNSGAIIDTSSLEMGRTSVAIGGSSTTNITQILVGSGGLTLHSQNLALARSTDATYLGLELVLNGKLTSTGNSTISVNTTAALMGNSKTQIRLEGADREVHVTGTLTVSSPFAGSGSYIKRGDGVMKLAGAHHNTYSGRVIVEAGQLDLQKNDGSNAIQNVLELRGGKVFLHTSNQIENSTGSIHQSGGILDLNHRTETFQDYLKLGGTVINNAGNITILGTLKGVGGTSMTEVESNPIYTVNSGGHTYAGTLDFSESTKNYALLIGGNSANSLTRFTVGEGGLKLKSNHLVLYRENAGSELVLQGDVWASGSNLFTRGSLGASGTRVAQLQQGANTRVWNIADGTTVVELPIVGSGAGLTKTGSGTLELREISTYTGKSTFQEGTVKMTASAGLSATPWVELGAPAVWDLSAHASGFESSIPMLSGEGVIRGHLKLAQDTSLRPGSSSLPQNVSSAGDRAGTLHIQGDLDATQLRANEVLRFNIQDATHADRLSITGDLSLNEHSKILVLFDVAYQAKAGDTWTLMEWGGLYHNEGFDAGSSGRTGDNAGAMEGQLDLPTLLGGLYWHFDAMDTSRHLRLSVVPEPRTSILLALGLCTLLLRRKRLSFFH